MIFITLQSVKSCSLSTQSLASCVNYFWNCLLCFSKHTKGSVTSFSILFNFQGPVAPLAFQLIAYLLYHRSDFCQALFFEVLRFSELVSCNLLSASARNLTSSYWFFRFTSQRRLRSHSLSPRLVLEYNTTNLMPCQHLFCFFRQKSNFLAVSGFLLYIIITL